MTNQLKRMDSPENDQQLRNVKHEPAKAQQMPLLRRQTDTLWTFVVDKDRMQVLPKETKNSKYYRRKSDVSRCADMTDNDLVTIIQTQNREAYNELLQRYHKKLFVYMYHLIGNKDEVEDLLQNVFAKTYKSINHFDTERKFSSWIYRIAHNESVNFLKRKSKKQFISWEDIVSTKDKLETQSDEKLPEEIWMQQELTQEVSNAMQKLPEKYKQVLILRYFAESSYEAIGEILGKPVNTVGTLINRAKKKLTEVMEQQEQERKAATALAVKRKEKRAATVVGKV